MNIVIHREKAKDAKEAAEYLYGRLNERYNSIFSGMFTAKYKGSVIEGPGMVIHFRCGNIDKMAGMIPNYYNADTDAAYEILELQGSKVNGKSVRSVYDVAVLIDNKIKDAISQLIGGRDGNF